jgi:hypothetical protein
LKNANIAARFEFARLGDVDLTDAWTLGCKVAFASVDQSWPMELVEPILGCELDRGIFIRVADAVTLVRHARTSGRVKAFGMKMCKNEGQDALRLTDKSCVGEEVLFDLPIDKPK